MEEALSRLREAIQSAVRQEQLRDRKTELANDVALNEWLQEAVEADGAATRWVAFLEVDHFKRVNDEFGHHEADEILRRIADQMKAACKNNLPTGTLPYRAHGDEFFLSGSLRSHTEEQLLTALSALKSSIAAIFVEVAGTSANAPSRMMKCTVSVGWLLLADIQKTGRDLTPRSILDALELACGAAKVRRDDVRRFSSEMVAPSTINGRADCSGCNTKFRWDSPAATSAQAQIWCPSCGQQQPAPPRPA